MLTFLSKAGKERWQARATVGNVVLVDDHSTVSSLEGEPPQEGTLIQQPILTLRDALFKVRVHIKYKCLIILEHRVLHSVVQHNHIFDL